MYISQVMEDSENNTLIDGQQGPVALTIDRDRLVENGVVKKIVKTVNDTPKEMDKCRKNSEPNFGADKNVSSVKMPEEIVENRETAEESDDFRREEIKNNVKDEKISDTVVNKKAEEEEEEEEEGSDDSFDDEHDEPETTRLFGNKIQSIFIRRSTIDCEGEESVKKVKDVHMQHPDKWIAKKKSGSPKKTRKLKKKHALSFFDTLITLFVVAPLVIGQWRGIWSMMDVYKDYFPEWICFILGTSLHALFAIARNQLHGKFVEKWSTKSWLSRVAFDFVRLTYIYIFCVACNAQWRGGWMIFSKYFGGNIVTVCVFTTLFTAALLVLRAFRNLLAPPFIVVIDQPERVFHFPTRYNVNTRDWSLYILDCAFSVGVVGSLVVFVWRGVWVLFDIHLFPENREYSAIGSLIIGYIIVAVTFCLQPLMRYTCARLDGIARLLAADAFLLLSFLGTVNVWRGIWGVLDLWLLPDDIEMSCWITHIGCFIFLVLLNCSNSILVRGVYIDAEEEEGRCVVFPCHYLRLFFKIERQKKEARRQNLVAANKEVQSCNEGNTKEGDNETLLNCSNTMPTIIPASPESLV